MIHLVLHTVFHVSCWGKAIGISLQSKLPRSTNKKECSQHTIRIWVLCILCEDGLNPEASQKTSQGRSNLCMARRFDQKSTIIPFLWSLARSCGPFLWSGAQNRLDNLTTNNQLLKETQLAVRQNKRWGVENVLALPIICMKCLYIQKKTWEKIIPGQQCNNWWYNASEIEHRVSHQPFHGPVGIGWRMADWARSIVNQSHKEK